MEPTAPDTPAKNWFAKLDPAWRALIVLAISTAFSVGWQKLFPGTPTPPLPPVQPTVFYVGPHDTTAK